MEEQQAKSIWPPIAEEQKKEILEDIRSGLSKLVEETSRPYARQPTYGEVLTEVQERHAKMQQQFAKDHFDPQKLLRRLLDPNGVKVKK